MIALTTPVSILVAEDDLDDIFFLEEAVQEIGLPIDLTFVENGRILMENLRHRQSPPDLIFLDINMPEMNGLEACREILSNPGLNTVPLIILTTSGDEFDRDLCLGLGAKAFVTKPMNINELSNILKGLIDQWVIQPRSPITDQGQHSGIQSTDCAAFRSCL